MRVKIIILSYILRSIKQIIYSLIIQNSINKETNQVVAIKQIDLEDSDDDISEIQQEIALLSQCDSSYITRYYGSFVKGFKLWIGK